mmetsp:Transcript_2103/g.6271  ORF Transcript_2103/g.6271 Transcript_2103/m.6271 type:complete len:325 (-) Transcript_2103:377-1351(-)
MSARGIAVVITQYTQLRRHVVVIPLSLALLLAHYQVRRVSTQPEDPGEAGHEDEEHQVLQHQHHLHRSLAGPRVRGHEDGQDDDSQGGGDVGHNTSAELLEDADFGLTCNLLLHCLRPVQVLHGHFTVGVRHGPTIVLGLHRGHNSMTCASICAAWRLGHGRRYPHTRLRIAVHILLRLLQHLPLLCDCVKNIHDGEDQNEQVDKGTDHQQCALELGNVGRNAGPAPAAHVHHIERRHPLELVHSVVDDQDGNDIHGWDRNDLVLVGPQILPCDTKPCCNDQHQSHEHAVRCVCKENVDCENDFHAQNAPKQQQHILSNQRCQD